MALDGSENHIYYIRGRDRATRKLSTVRKINTMSSKKTTVQDRNHQITALRVEYEFLMGHNPKALVLFSSYKVEIL